MLALEVNRGEEEEKRVKGSGGLNWTSSIFPVFTYNSHAPNGAHIVCEVPDCISYSSFFHLHLARLIH